MLDTSAFASAAVCTPRAGVPNHAFGPKRLRILGGETDGRVSVFEATIPPGEGPPMHVHEREDETFHVISGCLRIWCGAECFDAAAGATAVLPRGIPHRFQNLSETPAEIVVQCTPGGFEGFFVDVERQGATTPEEISAIAGRYGLVFLPE